MSNEEVKPYSIVIILIIVVISAMSVGIFVIMSSWIQKDATRFAKTAEILNNYKDLAESDIQTVLSEDSGKYEIAYSYLNDLYILNDQYKTMEEMNETGQINYTQQDFDEVKMEFTSKMTLLNVIVQTTWVYIYSVNELGAVVENNYTYKTSEYFFIINQWYAWDEPHEEIDEEIRDYVNDSFYPNPIELPEIKFEKWTYHLYNNLSMLDFIGICQSVGYIQEHVGEISFTLVNLSLSEVADYSDGYVYLSARINGLIQDLNNTLITLALAGVLLGFAASFEKKSHRRISIIIGLIIFILSIVYFMSTTGTLTHIDIYEAAIIRPPDFQVI